MTDAEDTPIELPKTPSIYDSRWDRLIGKKKASKPDSNTRRLISRISILMICGMIIGLLFDRKLEGVLAVFPILFILWSTYFFGFIVYIIPFLTSKTFFPNPIRLAKDGLISITLTVLSYAYLYNTFGLNPPGNEMLYSQWDALYFSAVTFSVPDFVCKYSDKQELP